MKDKFEIVYNRMLEAELDKVISNFTNDRKGLLCKEYWCKMKRLHEDFNSKDCWDLIVNNIQWILGVESLYGIKIMSTKEIREWFSEEELNQHGIYTKGTHEFVDKYVIGMGEAHIMVSGHSRLILYDNAKGEVYDTSFVSGYMNSHFKIKEACGEAFGNTTIEARGYSKVELWDKSKGIFGKNVFIVDRRY